MVLAPILGALVGGGFYRTCLHLRRTGGPHALTEGAVVVSEKRNGPQCGRPKVDITVIHRSFVAVSRFRNRFGAMFVVAFWLLATQHCGLEAAGIFDSHAAEPTQGCCPGGEAHCSHDGCELVEGRGVNLLSAAKAPQPHLELCLSLLLSLGVEVPEPEPAPRVRGEAFGRPLEWIATWQFVQRTALSPRAPSLALA